MQITNIDLMSVKPVLKILILSFIFKTAIFAQQSSYHIHEDKYYRKAMELFKKENYGAAQDFFKKAYDYYGSRSSALKSKAQYYSALCAIKLFNEDAEYLTYSFIKENPENWKKDQLNAEIRKNYKKTKWKEINN